MQRDAGAKGITCQKLGEAEVMAEAGLDDILIAYNILGEEKLGRLGRLLANARVSVAADNPVTIEGLPAAAAIAGRPLDVVVETPGEAIELARKIAASPGLAFAGFLFYPPDKSSAASQSFVDAALAGVRAAGLDARVVSSGGTPNLAQAGALAGVTEHRAGTYVFNDRMMMAQGVAALADCAMHVHATIVSRAGNERGILDAGSKTLTPDTGGGLDGFGLIREYPQARIAGFSEEHGMLDLSRCNDRPPVGTLVRIVPNHVCVAVNMVDRMIAVRGGEIVGELPVAARGRIG
jgi:D-serine deaminase-like pyridoxal phosphate-dependent protein